MTTIKRLTGIARGGFEATSASGGIPTRRELGGRKRTAPSGGRGGERGEGGRESVGREIRTRHVPRVARLAGEARDAGTRDFSAGAQGKPSSGSEISAREHLARVSRNRSACTRERRFSFRGKDRTIFGERRRESANNAVSSRRMKTTRA